MDELVISPIFYMGNKKKLIKKGLVKLFPSNIHTFVDLFSGSCIVSMNTTAENYVINDKNTDLFNLYKIFDGSYEDIIEQIEGNIEKFELPRKGIKQNTADAGFYKDRYIKFREYANKTGDIVDIYTCMFFAFSQQMRYNKNHKFNMPFGNGAFLEEHKTNIRNGCNFFSTPIVNIFNLEYNKVGIDNLTDKDFVYCDCPYTNTTATYNEQTGWGVSDDELLFEFLEKLNDKGIKWGLSNVFENKGIVNSHLIDWCDKNNWTVYTFDKHTYVACGKGNSNSKEVYICNYTL